MENNIHVPQTLEDEDEALTNLANISRARIKND